MCQPDVLHPARNDHLSRTALANSQHWLSSGGPHGPGTGPTRPPRARSCSRHGLRAQTNANYNCFEAVVQVSFSFFSPLRHHGPCLTGLRSLRLHGGTASLPSTVCGRRHHWVEDYWTQSCRAATRTVIYPPGGKYLKNVPRRCVGQSRVRRRLGTGPGLQPCSAGRVSENVLGTSIRYGTFLCWRRRLFRRRSVCHTAVPQTHKNRHKISEGLLHRLTSCVATSILCDRSSQLHLSLVLFSSYSVILLLFFCSLSLFLVLAFSFSLSIFLFLFLSLFPPFYHAACVLVLPVLLCALSLPLPSPLPPPLLIPLMLSLFCSSVFVFLFITLFLFLCLVLPDGVAMFQGIGEYMAKGCIVSYD